jgi:hypothetical protein
MFNIKLEIISDKRNLLNLKALLDCTLSEAKKIANKPHWFGGLRLQMQNAQKLLLEEGVKTIVENVERSENIRMVRSYPYYFHTIHHVLAFLKGEKSHYDPD